MMKLKQRILAAVLASCVLLTIVLVLDVENRLAGRPPHLTPSHGKVQYGFQHRHLQKTTNGSRESNAAPANSIGGQVVEENSNDFVPVGGEKSRPSTTAIPTPAPDKFNDLVAVVIKAEEMGRLRKLRRKHWNPSIGELLGIEPSEEANLWDRFHLSISRDSLYPPGDEVVPALLRHVAVANITHISQKEGGTQLKLIIEFEDGGHALFKPMRFTREQQTLKNHFYFTDFERHNAEIAAFHLDRLLGFRRAVPVVGRLVNITKELYALAQGDLLKTFFISPDNNLCFHGKCSYYCDTAHAICGSPDMLEGSLAIYLPGKDAAPRKIWRHPWRRSYHKRRKAQWEVDDDYCELVKEVHPYSEGRRMLDLMDMSVLDFLMGNMDRHHYETFKMFGNNSAPVHLDHGRAFGKPFHDELSILAPVYQCCLIRHSTLGTLLRYQRGPKKLSEDLHSSLKEDPLYPVLWEPHFIAADRRLGVILQVIRECIDKVQDPLQVVINDFH